MIQVLVPQRPAPGTAAPIACMASFDATIRWALGMLAASSRASIARTRSSASIPSGREISSVTSASVIHSA